MISSADIRKQFIEFFVEKHGHTFVPSSPVVPHDDPTLLFTNAGMNQFKPLFLGTEKRAYTRAVNTQKCIRAGGKHNDLDDVGRSRRHHTFFEMLGNWSFGDYFKKEAIAWSWELLTQRWGIDPRTLHVTVHAGDAAIGVERDNEAAQIWREVANWEQYSLKSDDHIHYGNTKDNFWEMGETGPCGPCTEIFVDRTPDGTGGPTVLSGEDPRVMEIWNNVFIQYNRNADRSLTPLPAQHVDTGMGLERIIQVLQGKQDNYGIDLFDPFWAKLKELSGITYTGKYPPTNSADPVAEAADPQLRHDIAFRVIADHIRCLTFALTDGAVPSNEGRGYVLRRILRRAVRFGRQQLELREPFLHTLVPVVVEAMGDAFPELRKNPERVIELVKDEEVSFGRTWERGVALTERVFEWRHKLKLNEGPYSPKSEARMLQLLRKVWPARATNPLSLLTEDERETHGYYVTRDCEQAVVFEQETGVSLSAESVVAMKSAQDLVPGEAVFKLHDTYGFPVDLTRIMAEERGMTVDLASYEKLMDEAREKARSGGKETDNSLTELLPDVIAKLQAEGVANTDDSAKYSGEPTKAKVVAIWDGSQLKTEVDDTPDRRVAVMLDRTNHYSEMGGQIGDQGALRMAEGLFEVETTRVVAGYVLHVGQMLSCGVNGLRIGDEVSATLSDLRDRTQQNHTTTHLANWALREVLGNDVQQKGSLVDPEKLRFDFSHNKAIADDELGRIEQLVNESIAKKLTVYAGEAPQEQALKINGLRAVFGEKYPPMVRVVSIGAPVADLLKDPANEKWRQFSIEFCGGTHLKSSDEAAAFLITAEESVSKGIRRIVANTGDAAKQVKQADDAMEAMLSRAKSAGDEQSGQFLQDVQKSLAVSPLSLRTRRKTQAAIKDLQTRVKAFEKTQKQSAAASVDVSGVAEKLLSEAKPIGPGKLVVADVPGAPVEQLLTIVDSLKTRAGSYAVLLGSVADEKVGFVAAVSDDVIKLGLKAGDWIRETAKVAGGGGGGRPQHAQAGGKDPSKLAEALETGRAFAAKIG